MYCLYAKIKKHLSIILLFVIVLIPLFTLCYFLLYDNYVNRHVEQREKNLQMAQVLAQNIDTFLNRTKTNLLGIGTMDAVKNQDRQELEKIFSAMQITQSEISLWWVTDANGNLVAKYPYQGPDKSTADKEFFTEALKGKTYVSDRVTGELTGIEIIVVTVPYYNRQGQIAGTLGASIPLAKLQEKLKVRIGDNGYPIMVSKSGRFLAHPRLDEVRQKVQPGDPIWQVLLKGGEGSFEAIAPFDGKKKLWSYVPIKESDWILVVIQPLSEFEAQLNNLVTHNALVIFLVLVVVAMAARYLVLARNREEEVRVSKAEKLAAVGQLAAGMAHEIRNPLTSIKGFVQMIASRPDRKAPGDYLDTMMGEIERIQDIVSEFLVLAKPTPANFLPIDLGKIVKEVENIMQPQAVFSNVIITTVIPPMLPKVLAERNQLKQALINLIKNSLEAMTDGGNVKVEIHNPVDDELTISVQDTGCGMPQTLINKLGTPFLTTKEQGTGLGLMITYRIIQNHGGSIEVHSVPEQGTTFLIHLPALPETTKH